MRARKREMSGKHHLVPSLLVLICQWPYSSWAFLVAQLVKNPPAMWETWVWSLGWEDPLEKGKATHSNKLAWRIPCTVWSLGSQTVRHDWVTSTFILFFYRAQFLLGIPSYSITTARAFAPSTCPDRPAAKSLQSCPTPCDPVDSSPPGSPVPGILQARTLEWVAVSFSSPYRPKDE